MPRFLVLLVCCLMPTACVPALVTKSPGAYGRVLDARSQMPVAGACVTFPRSGPSVLTGQDGRYDIPSSRKLGVIVLLPLEFRWMPLEISHPSYLTEIVRIYSTHERRDISLRRTEDRLTVDGPPGLKN